ncbi:MAG TPA: DUF899 domain-containing protein [Actinopolymorphaceae bacterium]|nr:DUF899 domain-containing protein [Actinopolymorphaceae bacterium]
MSLPQVVSQDEWIAARKELLAKEKELTRVRDALSADRRRLPMVKVEKDYVFEGPAGKANLLDLFEGRRQLMVYHFMWLYDAGEPKDAGCPNCSGFANEISEGELSHLRERETTFALVSRAPLAKIEAFKARMGWTFPWYSSYGSDFNFDFHVSFDESVTPIEYNYRSKAEWAKSDFDFTGWEQPFDLHGLSCFLRDGSDVHHTYSTYGRGAESVGGGSYFLDLTALGRQEDWEEPKGRAGGAPVAGDARIRYPDEYDD